MFNRIAYNSSLFGGLFWENTHKPVGYEEEVAGLEWELLSEVDIELAMSFYKQGESVYLTLETGEEKIFQTGEDEPLISFKDLLNGKLEVELRVLYPELYL